MSKPSVLVVDDDPVILRLVSANLKIRGFDVFTAGEGESALGLVSEAMPDLVILDIMMPGMDGVEVCRRIRERSTIPVMMMSARAEVESQAAAVVCGANDYVCKPFAIDDLLDRVRGMLNMPPYSAS